MINMIYQCMNVEYIKKKNMGSVKRWLSMNPETTFKLDDLRLLSLCYDMKISPVSMIMKPDG